MTLRHWLRHLLSTGPVPQPQSPPAHFIDLTISEELGYGLQHDICVARLDASQANVARITPDGLSYVDITGRLLDIEELDRMYGLEAK
ncbi:MAG: hypothetical protein ABFD89_00720 [Bryobacteraceae bacterium]